MVLVCDPWEHDYDMKAKHQSTRDVNLGSESGGA